MINARNACSVAVCAAALAASFVFSPSAAFAQKGKGAKKPPASAPAKARLAPGIVALPGETLEVGTMYMTGAGDNRINLRIDKAELVNEYRFIYGGNKNSEKVSDPDKEAFLVIHLTVQNLSSKPRAVFNTDVGGKDFEPYLQIGTVRDYKNEYDGTPQTAYFLMDSQAFRREGDGLTLRLEGPKEQYNVLQPGQTLRAFIARRILRAEDPPLTALQVNYTNSPVADHNGTGKDVIPSVRKTLLTFDLRGKVTK